jgi:hypothetical protein
VLFAELTYIIPIHEFCQFINCLLFSKDTHLILHINVGYLTCVQMYPYKCVHLGSSGTISDCLISPPVMSFELKALKKRNKDYKYHIKQQVNSLFLESIENDNSYSMYFTIISNYLPFDNQSV